MAWVVMVAVTVLVGYLYVEKIEKVRDEGKRVFSYFVVAVGDYGEAMVFYYRDVG